MMHEWKASRGPHFKSMNNRLPPPYPSWLSIPMPSASIRVPPLVCHFSRYFQAGGSPENVIQLLSENYTAVAQTVHLLAEWLIQTGALWGCLGPACSPPPSFSLDHFF